MSRAKWIIAFISAAALHALPAAAQSLDDYRARVGVAEETIKTAVQVHNPTPDQKNACAAAVDELRQVRDAMNEIRWVDNGLVLTRNRPATELAGEANRLILTSKHNPNCQRVSAAGLAPQ